MKEKTKLREIDREHWRFVLYEGPDKGWVGDFVYSPISFVDLSMLISLSDAEKRKAMINRNYLIKLSEKIRNNYEYYLKRSLKREDYEFILESRIK